VKSQRLIDTYKLGPLEVSIDPPMLWWHGIKQPAWRASNIRLLAILIEESPIPPSALEQRMYIDHSSIAKISQLRNSLALSGLPIQAVGVFEENSRRLLAYKLEIAEGA
jgi:hypothetical protein